MTLGVLLSRRGLWIEAVPYMRRAVEAPAGLRAAYERAIELEPQHSRALYGLGIVLDRLKKPDDAIRMYRRSREAAGR
jgi:Flp pilus assembly protein TadD